ncbi:hypothetical protein BBJ28_00014584 [Nothophytophthora sp. Chile5]|nr:hypothetical protein BBJ28_00014584 [Nothophytophthora sp. Chile5]
MTLIAQFEAGQCEVMRQSGTVEECEQRERLQDIVSRAATDEEKKVNSAKQRRVERLGELLIQCTMDELDKDDDDSGEVEDNSDRKATKCDQLTVVTDAIADAISLAEDDNMGTYNYKLKRLEFERDQAEKKRQHGEAESNKGRGHEHEMERRQMNSTSEEMSARHKTLQEHQTFLDSFEGIEWGGRLRLYAEHRTYLAGGHGGCFRICDSSWHGGAFDEFDDGYRECCYTSTTALAPTGTQHTYLLAVMLDEELDGVPVVKLSAPSKKATVKKKAPPDPNR